MVLIDEFRLALSRLRSALEASMLLVSGFVLKQLDLLPIPFLFLIKKLKNATF